MIDFASLIFSRLSVALLVSTSLCGAALAQSLPEIAPETIAGDVERRTDPRTGETEYIAGSFDPFESETGLAGSAALRSASGATAIDGQYVSGGAFLDISTIYTTASADSFDVRGFETARFYSGQPLAVIKYDRETLECDRSTRVVSYDPSYYRGASYGYIGGLYRLFPRYRGHRHFGWNGGIWDRGYWDRNYVDYVSRRNYRSRLRDRGHDRRGLDDRSEDRRRTRDRDRRRDTETAVRRDRDDVTSRGDRNRDRTDSRRVRDRQNANDQTRRDQRESRDRESRRNRDNDSRRDSRQNDTENARTRTDRTSNAARRDRSPLIGNNAESRRTQSRDQSRRARSDNREVRAPRSVSQATPRPPATSPPPRPARTDSAPASRPARESNPRPARPARASRPEVNRAVDRTFKNSNPRTGSRGNRGRNFYPDQYVREEVSVSYRCVKEEKLTVHIPQERLDAARFDGFAIMLIDNAGREVPVFVPPNYVEGFRQAVGVSAPQTSGYIAPQNTYSPPQPAPLPSSREPIVYGKLD